MAGIFMIKFRQLNLFSMIIKLVKGKKAGFTLVKGAKKAFGI